MSKKKHHHEEHEEHVNHEAWVIPYADMLTLLMALFLVMWATSQTDASKAKAVAAGFADSLGIHGDGSGVGGDGVLTGASAAAAQPPKPQLIDKKTADAFKALDAQKASALQSEAARKDLQNLQTQIQTSQQQSGVPNQLAFRLEGRGLVVSIVSEGVLFDAGSADLRPEGRTILDRVVAPLLTTTNRIAIEGHTDNRPISTGRFPSNWELSTARASSVLRYLVAVHGMNPSRLTASGYADQQPVAPNTDDAGRARNRRVDLAISGVAPVAITDSAVPDLTPKEGSP